MESLNDCDFSCTCSHKMFLIECVGSDLTVHDAARENPENHYLSLTRAPSNLALIKCLHGQDIHSFPGQPAPAPTALHPSMLQVPELNAALQVWSHKSGVENRLPWHASKIYFHAAQDTTGFLGCKGTLLAHVQFAIRQNSQVFFWQGWASEPPSLCFSRLNKLSSLGHFP